MPLLKDIARGFLQLVYPSTCYVCGAILDADGVQLCPSCRAALTADPHSTCPRCAGTVGPYIPLDEGCPSCKDSSFHFDGALRLGPYEGLLREVILRLKHHSGEGLAEMLGALWAEHAAARLRALKAGVVVPVPLHWWRRWTRGYNQSEVLAHGLADGLSLPCRPSWLRRVRATPQQTRQTPSSRRQNVRGAFKTRPVEELRGKTILLVDDVLTTGSTCSEAARALRAGGAGRVVVAVLARSQG